MYVHHRESEKCYNCEFRDMKLNIDHITCNRKVTLNLRSEKESRLTNMYLCKYLSPHKLNSVNRLLPEYHNTLGISIPNPFC